MPTFGRLVGAVWFGALAWYVCLLIIPQFPQGTNLGWFQEISAVIGLYVGWTIAGPRAGSGYGVAISYGLMTMMALVVLALFATSFFVMVDRAFAKRYEGLADAVLHVFEVFAENAAVMATPQIAITLLCGGIVGGMVTEFFGRRFR